ncbi:pyridoxamine 5'-phosphate oxidase family protein [Bacillus subtilis]|uniref:pyridoxamine 5'-phosphate oxidase family protein n=1 Tax=Bacillus TaxID=1386 RepID=UPI000FFE0B50|nr:pyridoxamine 5'-phosphate oxidase family protein [Bacillus subtilis]MBR0006460.1 pyridoxamine 5'-phosphate oxidase family protein [Bacillus subtilis]MCF7605014.1 pyridoxamine 5'-phosphate oxidase family protein [Bacillus subtilis]MCF7611487.1 pyridoxamine 5'-phosphate oxidase family protein [Bacillus subtilis]QAT44561.1 pyridoxamine 5'-phosphate oxidase family protein [Bacillus subtilis]
MIRVNCMSDRLFELLDGSCLNEKQHEAFVLQTVSEDGWPHAAMISAGEIIALSRTDIRIALWKNTMTSANILRTGKAQFTAWWKGAAYYVKLECAPLPPLKDAEYDRDRFSCRIVSVKEDVAKYADLTSGVRIQLHSAEEVLSRWEKTLEDLKR